MKFMVMVRADKNTEAGVMPSQKLLAEMGKFTRNWSKAGVMLAGEGLQASSKGARVRFNGSKRTVIDGPFAETKELIAGFWMLQVSRKKKRSSGSSAAPIRSRASAKSRSARCSRPRTSAPSSRRSCGRRKNACASRSPRRVRR